jgi:hypothetical protein
MSAKTKPRPALAGASVTEGLEGKSRRPSLTRAGGYGKMRGGRHRTRMAPVCPTLRSEFATAICRYLEPRRWQCSGRHPRLWKSASGSKSTATCRPSSDLDPLCIEIQGPSASSRRAFDLHGAVVGALERLSVRGWAATRPQDAFLKPDPTASRAGSGSPPGQECHRRAPRKSPAEGRGLSSGNTQLSSYNPL